MISSEDAIALLNKWKSGSAKVFIHSSCSGISCCLVGKVEHASRAEVLFGIEGVDGKDFLLSVVCSSAEFSVLKLDKENLPFFSPRRDFRDFGETLEISLRDPGTREISGRLVVAEVFMDKFVDI